jgi:hypothetical protein
VPNAAADLLASSSCTTSQLLLLLLLLQIALAPFQSNINNSRQMNLKGIADIST